LFDFVLIAMTVASFGYYIIDYPQLVHRVGYYTNLDFAMALMATIVSLEATRRVMGWMLPIVAGVFLLALVTAGLQMIEPLFMRFIIDRVILDAGSKTLTSDLLGLTVDARGLFGLWAVQTFTFYPVAVLTMAAGKGGQVSWPRPGG
jgi:TRAP-type uncharacterized transport system fused permease subunit